VASLREFRSLLETLSAAASELRKTWNRAVVFRGRGVPGFPQCVSGLVPLLLIVK
jgi:hypothetical protein